jgi:hypothetical protein
MKKLIGITALTAFSLTLFSFSTNNEKKAAYNELKAADFIAIRMAGSFSQYQSSRTTAGEGTWNFRVQTWTLTDGNSDADQLEKVLNN